MMSVVSNTEGLLVDPNSPSHASCRLYLSLTRRQRGNVVRHYTTVPHPSSSLIRDEISSNTESFQHKLVNNYSMIVGMPTRCHEILEGLLYSNLFITCQNDWQVDNLSIVTADVLPQAQANYSPTNAIIELPSVAAQIWT